VEFGPLQATLAVAAGWLVIGAAGLPPTPAAIIRGIVTAIRAERR